MFIAPQSIPQTSGSMSDTSDTSHVTSAKSQKASQEQNSPTSSITTLVPQETQDSTSMPETAPEQARQRTNNTSIGDNGITASTSAYGHLLQITRYFGNKPSGFFCVDLEGMPIPFLVNHRMETLQKFSADPKKGMQVLFKDFTIGNEKPAMSFIHDRWPCFEAKSQMFDLSIEYFISGETVYQMYTIKLDVRSEVSQETPTFAFNAKLFLRNLNFAIIGDENKRPLNDVNYDTLTINSGNSVMRIHKDCNTGLGDRDAVALVISPFINDCACRITKSSDERSMVITLDESTAQEFRTNKKIQITLAYTLQLVSSSNLLNVSLPIPPKVAKEQISQVSFEQSQFVEDSGLNFTLRRNLEHVLTVCSIPTGEASGEDEIRPVALTCGDISGHRIATEASFYAFELLLLAFEFYNNQLTSHPCTLEERSCGDSACRMRSRIWRTCRGHLEWLLLRYGVEKECDLRTDFWATGEEIIDEENNSQLFQKPFADTTLSVIKFANFYRMTGTQCNASDKLRRLIKYWIHNLQKFNTTHKYFFPSVIEATPRIFDLSDHAMIWWGIKSAEELGLESELKNIPSVSNAEQNKINYSSREIRTSILRNFTTENPRSNNSTIAFSRSAARNRFKLRTADTLIFYAISAGLLLKESISSDKESVSHRNMTDAWYNTKDCQSLYKDNRDVNWNHPLQFALAIIMSTSGHPMNKRTTVEMYDRAKSVLLQSSSPNGLFSGHLNESEESPLFDHELMRDSYWHTTFEVPYILWKYRKPTTQRKKLNSKNNTEVREHDFGEIFTGLQVQNLLMSMMVQPGLQFQNNQPQSGNNTMASPKVSTQHKDLRIKKSATFDNSVNQENIVELPDEWLYEQPEFFKYHRDLSEEAIKRFCNKPKDKTFSKVITEAIGMHQFSATGPVYSRQDPEVGYILDVPMAKNGKASIYPRQISNRSISEYISNKRTPMDAKKRLFHFYNASPKTALICYLGSSEAENMSSFFDRHASYDKYFVEDITAELNKWVTELHLSFYRINLDGSPHKATGFPKAHEIIFPSFGEGKSSKSASRSVMSFRLDGDIFNRYWTCHFLEHNPKSKNSEPPTHVMNYKVGSVWKANPWKQRKILDLLLFDIMLTEMLEGTQEIIDQIYNIPAKDFGLDYGMLFGQLISFDLLVNKSNTSKMISMSHLLNRLQFILQAVQKDLDESLDKIKLWTNRETEQGQDKPRWLDKHETNYRSAIFKLQALSERKIHQLQRFNTNIVSLNSNLKSSLESMRNDLNQRGSDDIRLFTYVTVIFLPISFATGVFSTSGAPSGQMIANLAVTAAIAMLITATMLINARILNAVVGPVLHIARQASEFMILRIAGPPFKFIASPTLAIVLKSIYLFVYYFARYILFPVQKMFPRTDSAFKTETFGKRFGFDWADPLRDARKDYNTEAKKKEAQKKEAQKKEKQKKGKRKDLEAGVTLPIDFINAPKSEPLNVSETITPTP